MFFSPNGFPGISHIDVFLEEILQVEGIVCPCPYGMELRMQDNFWVVCWTNVVKSESASCQVVCQFSAKHPEQSFKPGDRVRVRNCIVEPPVHGKLEMVWQGPCEVLRHISPGTYRVNIRGREDIFTSRRLKPYVPYKDDTKVPLLYYTDREGLIETDDYVVERVLEDRVVGGKRQW